MGGGGCRGEEGGGTFIKPNCDWCFAYSYCLLIWHMFMSSQAALVYEATAVCTYSAGQKSPFTKHVRIEGIGIHNQILLQGWLYC